LQRALEHRQLLHLGEGDVAMPARREEPQKLIERRRRGGLSGRGAGSASASVLATPTARRCPSHTGARGAGRAGASAPCQKS